MQTTALIFTFILHYYLYVTWSPNTIWKCSIYIGECASSWGQMWATGTKVHVNLLIIYVHTIYCFSPRNLVAQLQDIITKLTSLWHPQVPSTSDMAPNQDKTDSLDTSGPLQPLNCVDYPYVLFWHGEDWVKYADDEYNHGEVPSRLRFLTDEDGSLVPESQIKTFMSTVKQAWNELYHLWLDPKSWTKKTPKATSYLMHIMKTSFDKFWYCDGDWKVEWFAIIKYPNWCYDAREPGISLVHLISSSFIAFESPPSRC